MHTECIQAAGGNFAYLIATNTSTPAAAASPPLATPRSPALLALLAAEAGADAEQADAAAAEAAAAQGALAMEKPPIVGFPGMKISSHCPALKRKDGSSTCSVNILVVGVTCLIEVTVVSTVPGSSLHIVSF